MKLILKYFLIANFVILPTTAYPDSGELKENTLSIVKALAMTDLTVIGASITIKNKLPNFPTKNKVMKCFKKIYSSIIRDFYYRMLSQSLNKKIITDGAVLASKKSVINSYNFILRNTHLYQAEAKKYEKRLDAYMFILASEKSKNITEKNELLMFSKWIKFAGKKFSKEINANFDEYVAIMSYSLEKCMPKE